MPPNIESADGNSGPNSTPSNALSPHSDPDGNAGGISFPDELIRYATDHEGGNTKGGSAPECTCLLLHNVHGVDHECPLANDGKGGWAHNTNDNTGDKDGGTRPTDGSGNTDGNPHNKTTFRADATISWLFNMVPIKDQFIITKANMPKDCGPPSGKPRPPNFTGVSKKTSIDIPCGHLAEDHPPVMGEPVSTFLNSTGQNCKGGYVWLYDGFNREQWARDALRQLETETAAESLRRERLMEEYERETLAWEQAAVKMIKESGKADGISTMATRVTSRNERVNHLTAGLIAEGYSRAEIVEALLGIFPGVVPESPQENPSGLLGLLDLSPLDEASDYASSASRYEGRQPSRQIDHTLPECIHGVPGCTDCDSCSHSACYAAPPDWAYDHWHGDHSH
ncbi:MAG: hypothetical protein M1823_006150 [Watsoniomyces obsoletus]|nr:MAG: hypothetical protein M1823_006150 [Watsoniomyces obsoletus]